MSEETRPKKKFNLNWLWLLLLVPLCCLLIASAYLLWPHAAAAPTEAPAPIVPPIAPLVPTAIIDCGPWVNDAGILVFSGNDTQDVCQLGDDLATVRAGTPAHFIRTTKFTLAICAANISNSDVDEWAYTDCGQATGVTFPAGSYTIQQPAGYANGGFRATNVTP